MLRDPDGRVLPLRIAGESLPHLLPEGLALVGDRHPLLAVLNLDLESFEIPNRRVSFKSAVRAPVLLVVSLELADSVPGRRG